jgi:hypothetical protein
MQHDLMNIKVNLSSDPHCDWPSLVGSNAHYPPADPLTAALSSPEHSPAQLNFVQLSYRNVAHYVSPVSG